MSHHSPDRPSAPSGDTRQSERPLAENPVTVALSDEILAVRCLLGETEAFDELVERWHEPVNRYVASVIESEYVADTVQDIWLRVIRAFPTLRDPALLRPWLFGIARRALMDRHRRRYAGAVDVELVETDTIVAAHELQDDDLERAHERVETLARLDDTLSGMPLIEREVLVLFYLQELSLAQLANVLALPVGTVKSRLFRARRMLRDRLIAQGIEP